MAETSILLELGLIIGIAAVLAIIGKLVKQPSLIAYLATGIVIGPMFLGLLNSAELVKIFAHMGVAFFLFIVGLSLDFRVFKEIGKVATVAGLGQITITAILGFLIATSLGFSFTPALYLAAALALSSTIVVVKLLTDKKELDSLHGKIAIGILIVQDFVAAAILMVIPVVASFEPSLVVIQLLKGAVLTGAIFLFTYLIIPGVLSIAAKNQEVLFLFSIGWALLIAILFEISGFSIELGALIAGMSLASSKFSVEIGSKVKGLREFFVIIHLVFFGSLLVGPITTSLLLNAGILSLLVLIGNPIIVMSFMRLFGYKKQTNFLTGISIAQISEFSLILMLVGFTIGAITQQVLSLTILVALITIALSSYGIHYSRGIYSLLSPALKIFDGKGKKLGTGKHKKHYEVILFGYNRVGFSILEALDKAKKKYLIVDYDPKVISDLTEKGANCLYGDANDEEFLREVNFDKPKLIISTIPDIKINLTILNYVLNKKTMFIPTSHSIKDTKKLYDAGANYVIMPHFLGGEYVAHMILRKDFNKSYLKTQSEKQLKDLKTRIFHGHDHPTKDDHGK